MGNNSTSGPCSRSAVIFKVLGYLGSEQVEHQIKNKLWDNACTIHSLSNAAWAKPQKCAEDAGLIRALWLQTWLLCWKEVTHQTLWTFFGGEPVKIKCQHATCKKMGTSSKDCKGYWKNTSFRKKLGRPTILTLMWKSLVSKLHWYLFSSKSNRDLMLSPWPLQA